MPQVNLRGQDSEAAFIREGENSEEGIDHRQQYLLEILRELNLSGGKFDLTTYSGIRLLNCILPGEFATHLYGAYRTEVFEYRMKNIPIMSSDGKEMRLPLSDIWIVHPLPNKEISDGDLRAVDPSKADEELKEMIRKGYHCKSEEEFDFYLRRFLAT